MNQIAFLSGGTGMRRVSLELARRRLPTTHIITTFDSGGSSRALRLAFHMPAIGDIRNRLIALAAPERAGIADFLDGRLPVDAACAALAMQALPACSPLEDCPAKEAVAQDLTCFMTRAPSGFDASGASIGNLALAGAYLRFERSLPQAIARYAKILDSCGKVLPVCVAERQIVAKLVNGAQVLGQHLFKELPAAIDVVFLADDNGDPVPGQVYAEAASAIQAAQIVCLPMGSFYSSIIANLLPRGIGRAFAASPAKKVFIPDAGNDPELFDLDLAGQAQVVLDYLRRDAPDAPNGKLLNYVLIDSGNGAYPGGFTEDMEARLQALNLEIVDRPIVRSGQLHEPGQVVDALLELLAA